MDDQYEKASLQDITHSVKDINSLPVALEGGNSFDNDFNNYVYKIGEPFEKLSKIMYTLTSDIKKCIVRNGNGPFAPPMSTVSLKFKVYAENKYKPFDTGDYSKLINEIPSHGIQIALQTMCKNEVSQFLCTSQIMYGDNKFKFLSPNDSVLLVIHLIYFLDSKTPFRERLNTASAALCKGNELFTNKLYKFAVKEYKQGTLEFGLDCKPSGKDLEKQCKLLLWLYTNLVIASTKAQELHNACGYSKKVYEMCSGSKTDVPLKVYINHARCLMSLSNLKEAEAILHKAECFYRNNHDIEKEIFMLKGIKKSYTSIKPRPSIRSISLTVEISKDFKDAMADYCTDLLHDDTVTQYDLPDGLCAAEREYALEVMHQHGLFFKQYKVNGVTKYCISKSAEVWD